MEFVIVALLAVWVVFAIRSIKKHKGCCGNCSCCGSGAKCSKKPPAI